VGVTVLSNPDVVDYLKLKRKIKSAALWQPKDVNAIFI
jgi:hypothetical protein